jgi:hypothetical protein
MSVGNTNINSVKDFVVHNVDPKNNGFNANPTDMVGTVIGWLKDDGVPRHTAQAAIDKAVKEGDLDPALGRKLSNYATAQLKDLNETASLAQVGKETAAAPSLFEKIFDTLLEILSLSFAKTHTYDGVSREALDCSKQLGESAAADPKMRAEIDKAGGPAKFAMDKLKDAKVSDSVRAELAANFAKGYEQGKSEL